jgi:hypothetical protein
MARSPHYFAAIITDQCLEQRRYCPILGRLIGEYLALKLIPQSPILVHSALCVHLGIWASVVLSRSRLRRRRRQRHRATRPSARRQALLIQPQVRTSMSQRRLLLSALPGVSRSSKSSGKATTINKDNSWEPIERVFSAAGKMHSDLRNRPMQPHWSTRSLRLSTLTELLTRNWPFASADRFCHPVTWWEKYTVYGYYGSLCCAKYLPKYLAST